MNNFSSDLKVSIVVPVYNRAFMLPQVIKNLLAQSYSNIEIILIDDGSTDQSFEIMKSYPQIISLQHENLGPAAARNTGLKQASGDIVHFIDSDVIIPEKLVETHVSYHRKYPRHIIQGQLVRILDINDVGETTLSFRYYSRSFFDTANVSVKKEYLDAVKGFDEENFRKGWEDLDLGLRLLKIGLNVKRIYKKGYVWHLEVNIHNIADVHKYFGDRLEEGRAAAIFYNKHPSFSAKMMTMTGSFFFWLDKLIFNEEYLESELFYKKLVDLWKQGKKKSAVSKLRFAAKHYYLKGVQMKSSPL
jgi:glycosyltransferase involved in cell wall biosynthesis